MANDAYRNRFSTHFAETFYSQFEKNSNDQFHLFVGRISPWDNENNPDASNDVSFSKYRCEELTNELIDSNLFIYSMCNVFMFSMSMCRFCCMSYISILRMSSVFIVCMSSV